MDFDPRMTEETKTFITQAMQYGANMIDLVTSRQVFDAMADEQNKNTKFDNIEETEYFIDSLYDDYKIPITAYVPKTVASSSSIVVFTHGGGFNLGSRKSYRNCVALLADRSNAIWISVEYRLSPENKHPTQVHDCISVTKWIIQNKMNVFNLTKDAKVGVCGDSSGGHLAVSVALELREILGFQLLIYPWLDLTGTSDSYKKYANVNYLVTDELMSKNARDFVSDISQLSTPSVSPLFNNKVSGLPKCFILCAELDPLLDDGQTYHKKLQNSGIESKIYIIKGVIHGFFNGLFYENAYKEGINQITNFMKTL